MDLLSHVAVGAPEECWIWQGLRWGKGYGRYGDARAHRLIYAELVGDVPADMVVMHTCDNPPCCNPAHLRLGTHADNVRDREAKGRGKRSRRGEHYNTKIAPADAELIRSSRERTTDLAARYGVAKSTIVYIRGRRETEPVSEPEE